MCGALPAAAQLAVDCRNHLGEGLVWSARRGSLLWVDIEGRKLHEMKPSPGRLDGPLRSHILPERSGMVALTNVENRVVLALEGGVAEFCLETSSIRRRLVEEPFEANLPTTRPNDGRVDRQGRLIFGGYNEAHRSDGGLCLSAVYRMGGGSEGHKMRRLLQQGVRVANSICFSVIGGLMYFCDSPTRQILAYPYCASSNTLDGCALMTDSGPAPLLGVPSLFYEMPEGDPGFPDGATVDAEGGVWSAQFGASRVVRHDPDDGSITDVVELPVPNPTCVALGGMELKTLYITTTRRKMSEEELLALPEAGGVYAARVDIPGVPEPEYML